MSSLEDVKSLVESSDVARKFFESLAKRARNHRVTTVERAMRSIKAERKEVVDLFKQMADLELGSFILGRRTGVSRFEWSVRMVDVAKAGLGEIELEEIQSLENEELAELEAEDAEDVDEEEDGLVQHSFALRPRSAPVVFALPEDLTEQEAKRLSRFMLSLPIESSEQS